MQQITGKEVRKWREKRKLSRTQLASLLGISMDTIRNWETRGATPPPYLRLALQTLGKNVTVKKQTPVPQQETSEDEDFVL